MMKLRSTHAPILALVLSLLAVRTLVPGRLDASDKKSEVNTIHFTVRYQAGMEDLGITTAGLSEDVYVRVSNFLEHDLKHAITISVWPSRTGPGSADEMRPSRLCRHSPVAGGTRPIDVTFPGSIRGLRRSLTHAITHAFIYDMLADEPVSIPLIRAMPMPYWFPESLAEYLADLPDGKGSPPGCEVNAGFGPGLYSMTGYPAFPVNSADREDRGFIAFLDALYGRRCIGEIIRDIRDTGDFNEALNITTGKRLRDLEQDLSVYAAGEGWGGARRGDGSDGRDRMMNTNGISPGFALYPAVSPDGSRIAFLSTTSRSTTVTISSLAGKTGGVSGASTVSFERELDMGPGAICSVDNRISWTGDGKTLAMTGRLKSAEAVIFIDCKTGRIVSSETMPFSAVMFPSLSGNGRFFVFTGTAASSSDIYMYDRQEASLIRITEDHFFERDPVIATDGAGIIYSTNSNETGDLMRGAFDIVRRDIRTGMCSILVRNGFINIQPSLSNDGKRLLYISNEGGPFNIFMLDLATRKTIKLTNSPNGALYPAWFPSGNGMAYVVNQLQSSGLKVMDLDTGGTAK